jgi:AcrR family transcriptional regulator
MPTQVERRETTRAALLSAARELFTEKGFAGTGREEIAERAGVTRGALYHHFASKQAAFAAVARELEAELEARLVAEAHRGGTPFEQLQRCSRAYLDACADPSIVRILATEAPAVLGSEAVRAMNDATCRELLEPMLRRIGTVPGEVEVASQLLLGMWNEAAEVIAAAPNPKAAARKIQPTLDLFLTRLLS